MSSNKCTLCEATRWRNKDLFFHRIPGKAAHMNTCDRWLEFLGLRPSRECDIPKWKNIVVCSLHFEDSCYSNSDRNADKIRVTLKQGSIPTRNPPGIQTIGNLVEFNEYRLTHDHPITTEVECMEVEDDLVSTLEGVLECRPSTPGDMSTSVPYAAPPQGMVGLMPTSPSTSNLTSLPRSSSSLRGRCFRLKKLMGLCRGQFTSPRSSRMYEVAKKFKDRYVRMARRRLSMNPVAQDNFCASLDLLPECSREIVQSILSNTGKPKMGKRYSCRLKALALTVQKKSSSLYRTLTPMLQLPSYRTLSRIRQSIPLNPGVSKVILHSMAGQISSMSEKDKFCVLMFDEISLDKHVDYDPMNDQFLGFEDVAGARFPCFADHGLVFMARGLNSNWKQPVAYHLSHSISKGRLEKAIKETVSALQGIGLKPVALVSDLAQSNTSALQALAARTLPGRDDPCVRLGDNDIAVFADAPHLLKVLRNNFLKYDVQFTGRDGTVKIAKFDIFKEFLEYEKTNLASNIYPRKFSEININPNSKQKMKVKYAAQLFSVDVNLALTRYGIRCKKPEVLDLAEFIEMVDELFDSFNGSPIGDKNLRAPVARESSHHHFWNTVGKSISDWKFVVRSPGDKAPQSKCFYYWRRNVIAVQQLWKKLEELGVDSFCTRNLNQDPLESFFGAVRQQGGSNTNPTCKAFVDILKILSLNSLPLSSSKNCNVIDLNISLLSDLLNSISEGFSEIPLRSIDEGEGSSSTASLQTVCSVSKDVEASTRWAKNLPCDIETEEGLEMARNLFYSFLRTNHLSQSIFSCFSCFQSSFDCPHPQPSGLSTCKECSSPNLSLLNEVFQIYVSFLKYLRDFGYCSGLKKYIITCAGRSLRPMLSCETHGDTLFDNVVNFVLKKGVNYFSIRVNHYLHGLAGKHKS